MTIHEIYHYKPNQFDKTGYHTTEKKLFFEYIDEWQYDFHRKFPLYYANYLFGNSKTMFFIDRSMDFNRNEKSGMDLIDGQIDLDANLAMDNKSQVQTVFALGSIYDEDEPLFLIKDDSLSDGVVLLKYIPDEEEGDEEVENLLPVSSSVKK